MVIDDDDRVNLLTRIVHVYTYVCWIWFSVARQHITNQLRKFLSSSICQCKQVCNCFHHFKVGRVAACHILIFFTTHWVSSDYRQHRKDISNKRKKTIEKITFRWNRNPNLRTALLKYNKERKMRSFVCVRVRTSLVLNK